MMQQPQVYSLRLLKYQGHPGRRHASSELLLRMIAVFMGWWHWLYTFLVKHLSAIDCWCSSKMLAEHYQEKWVAKLLIHLMEVINSPDTTFLHWSRSRSSIRSSLYMAGFFQPFLFVCKTINYFVYCNTICSFNI